MARAQGLSLPAGVAIFLGGCLGGAARIAIDELVTTHGAVPWDIVAINVIGSFALGVVAARAAAHGTRWWTPLVTTGVLGGFTTFSAIAALQWTQNVSLAATVTVLAATTVAAVVAAAVGWRIGMRPSGLSRNRTPGDLPEDQR
jgi:CrcB protein